MKEIIKTKLKKYDYEFVEENNTLTVELGFSQFVIIDFSQDEKLKFKDKLKGWNFLTGMIEMSYKGAIIYQTIGLFVAVIFFMFLGLNKPDLSFLYIYILIGISLWLIMWLNYYLIKLENIKKQVISWIENNCE